jgi:tetratricopeptide (TPR) repeat protein
MKKYLVSLLLAAFFTLITIVETKAQRLTLIVESGDAAFANNNFYGAAVFYNQAILKDSTDINLQYKYAQASRLNFDYDIADHWYTKVYNQDKQGIQFPECAFWLATIKKSKVNYKDAQDLFAQYVQKNKDASDSYMLKKAKQEMAACEYAQWLVLNPDPKVTMIHLDSSVNSKLSEYAPYEVDSILYFSSLRNSGNRDKKNYINYNKIYASTQNATNWEKAKELDTLFNDNNIHNANTSFNADKTKMFITHCRQKNAQDFICDIFISELKNNVWSPLKKLPPEINADGYTNSQPATGFLDGKEVLFFSSNRPEGEGKIDIWYSKINSDGTYEAPVNAGKKINSAEDEITPFYCNRCNELFFSSTWHKGLGGFDIFKSAYKNGSFEEPQNAGTPINSPYNDIYFSINTTNTQAFLSSNRVGSFYEERESCCNDIYMYTIPFDSTAIKARQKTIADSLAAALVEKEKHLSAISQLKTFSPIMLYFHNDEPDRQSLLSTTSVNYKTHYKEYAAKRKLYKKVLVRGKKTKSSEVLNKRIDLFFDSVTTGMHNLNSFTLVLTKALQEGTKITVTIKSYCSPLASDKYNEHLAKRRIRSVENYFKEYKNGILKQYIKEGSLKFAEEVKGESETKSKISDSFSDIKRSVFNLKAAYERRAEITFESSNPEK